MSTVVASPTTEQLVAAIAQSLLPLAGPLGIAASALVPAFEQLLDTFKGGLATSQNYTVADLEAIVAKGNTDLQQLQTDIDAQGKGAPVA